MKQLSDIWRDVEDELTAIAAGGDPEAWDALLHEAGTCLYALDQAGAEFKALIAAERPHASPEEVRREIMMLSLTAQRFMLRAINAGHDVGSVIVHLLRQLQLNTLRN